MPTPSKFKGKAPPKLMSTVGVGVDGGYDLSGVHSNFLIAELIRRGVKMFEGTVATVKATVKRGKDG